jgi:hypothetical protein
MVTFSVNDYRLMVIALSVNRFENASFRCSLVSRLPSSLALPQDTQANPLLKRDNDFTTPAPYHGAIFGVRLIRSVEARNS